MNNSDSVRRGRRAIPRAWADANATIELRWPGKEINPVERSATITHVRTVGSRTNNLLVLGDAAHALASLGSSLSGQVALCYIDPPFNKGSDFTHYSDALTSGAWLGLLKERLLQIKPLLCPDASVWLHLDDSEQHRARCVMDEVFGPSAFVSTVIWQKRTSRDNRTAFSSAHDYIHVYSPAGSVGWKKRRNPLPDNGAFQNINNDPRGPWRSVPLSAQAGHATMAQFYSVTSPTGVVHDPPPGRCWTYSAPRFAELIKADRIYWPRAGAGRPRLKRFATEVSGLAPSSLWMADEVGDNSKAKKEMLRSFPDQAAFDTPKPESLMDRIVSIASRPGELVLDCFLGSGTTAVSAHKSGRRWIGIERESRTLLKVALPRLEALVLACGGGFNLVEVDEANRAATPATG